MQGVFILGSRDDAWLAKLQTIYRVESAVLLSVIGVGLALCALGATVHNLGRAPSVWVDTAATTEFYGV